MKNKLFAAMLAVMLAAQSAIVPMSASAPAADTASAPADTLPLSIKEKTPDTNVIKYGDFDDNNAKKLWTGGDQKIRLKTDENGGYMEFSNITNNTVGFRMKPASKISKGKYKFTGYFRTKNLGALTTIRLYFKTDDGGSTEIYISPTHEWMKVETYVDLSSTLSNIYICGGPHVNYVQSYCVDAFSLVPVDSIPEGGAVREFGTQAGPNTCKNSDNEEYEPEYPAYDPNEPYEVQGVVINQDADSFVQSVSGASAEKIAEYARSFGGTHVTDYVICLNNVNATFKSDTWTDLDDKYHQTVENGKPVDYTKESMCRGAHYLACEAKIDYIDIWCKTFPEVGINPWLSFRMNDSHDLSKETSKLLSDYFHEHPEIRRVQYESELNTYYHNAQDYTYELVRTHMLDLIDEALSKYDAYGIELDWQREMYLWHNGGEYAGLDILNGFMREVDAVVAKYEAKYGHEIKIGVRVASMPQVNYDMGLDITTWASEGIVDVVSPAASWACTENDTPVTLWKSVLDPYGVELWPNIECNIKAADVTGGHTLETYCGAAANYLSQGADKVYLFNYYRYINGIFKPQEKITTADNELSVTSSSGYWNVITTLGSYDKLMERNRRVILTYTDREALWVNTNKQLPKNIMPGKPVVVHIPMGDVPAGGEALVKFSVSDEKMATEATAPTVYINGIKARFAGTDIATEYTPSTLVCFEVPEETLDFGYALVEIMADNFVTISYAEAYIFAPSGEAAAPEAGEKPSSWAEAEVSAAAEQGIVPELLLSDYTKTITRAEFCKLIMQMINEVEGTASSRLLLQKKGIEFADNFIDTDNPDVIAANLLGILNGRGNGIFDPNSGITRQEAAVMLANAAKVMGIKAGTAPTFRDMDKAASWAQDGIKTVTAIKASTGNNVMNGTGNDQFSPLATYTREQSILTVYRLFMAK